MANSDSVSQFYLDSFGGCLVGRIVATQLNTAANAVVAIPLLSGGLTNSGASATSGAVIVRRVTVMNPSGSMSTANISITTSNDGNLTNAVTNSAALSSITAVKKFQDLAINGGNVIVDGSLTSALFVNVNVASGNANTADIRVYGDVVTF